MRLRDKVFVVLGGTSGIGRAATLAFIAEGARLVVLGKDDDHANALKESIPAPHRVLTADAADPGAADRAVNAALDLFGRFDGLYHVAGGSGRSFGDAPLHQLSNEGIDYTLDLNLKSVLYSNRAAVRAFLNSGRGGSILNVGSVLASHPSPQHFATHAYAAAKAALVGLTRSAAAFYATAGIRFNLIAPGVVDTPMSRRAIHDPAIDAVVRSRQPLGGGRPALPHDLAGAAVFLLSDESAFVTGQVLAIDGGWTVSDGTGTGSSVDEQESGERN